MEINTEVSKKKKRTKTNQTNKQKKTLELPLYALAIPHLSIYLEEMKKESQRDVCTPIHLSHTFPLFTTPRVEKQLSLSG